MRSNLNGTLSKKDAAKSFHMVRKILCALMHPKLNQSLRFRVQNCVYEK